MTKDNNQITPERSKRFDRKSSNIIRLFSSSNSGSYSQAQKKISNNRHGSGSLNLFFHDSASGVHRHLLENEIK